MKSARDITLQGPIRTCVGCRERRPQAMLARLAIDGAEKRPRILVDQAGKMPGRGAWLCAAHPDCLAKALLKGRLARALKVADPDLSAMRG